jgi:phosphoribosylanthranilate isomerase
MAKIHAPTAPPAPDQLGTRADAPAQLAPRVKVCGITTPEDALLATELGAWALGMIFYDGSPRRCSRAQAQLICAELRRRVELCGVFVNAPLEEVARASEELGLTLVQLHGDEGPSFCGEVRRRTGARVIKAAQVSAEGDVRDLERYHVDYHLLDTRARGEQQRSLRGGTGESFDWELVRARHSRIPLILSGGLSAENVAAAIASVRPWAVDSASSTESVPGHKDPRRLRAFFDAVAGAANPAADA